MGVLVGDIVVQQEHHETIAVFLGHLCECHVWRMFSHCIQHAVYPVSGRLSSSLHLCVTEYLQPIHKSHFDSRLVFESCDTVGDAHDALCLDGIDCLHRLLVLLPGSCVNLWYEIKAQIIIGTATVDIDG